MRAGVQGSGWVVAPQLVATNAHVVTGADRIDVASRGGQVLPATVVYLDPANDVALLAVEDLRARPLPVAQKVRDGIQVVLLGYPQDGPLTATPGTAGRPAKVFAADAYERRTRLRTVVPLRGEVERGDSGGPVVNRGGRVVAMMFAASAEGGGGFGVPAAEVEAALDETLAPVDPGPCPG